MKMIAMKEEIFIVLTGVQQKQESSHVSRTMKRSHREHTESRQGGDLRWGAFIVGRKEWVRQGKQAKQV